jgi:pimeloyl-ACP methyl ester carboxylesterase
MLRKVLITGTHTSLAREVTLQCRACAEKPVLVHAPECIEVDRVDDVWWLFGGRNDEPFLIGKLLASLPEFAIRTFYLVGPASRDLRTELAARCEAARVRCLTFQVPHTLGAEDAGDRSEFTRFLHILDSLAAEVEQRRPGHFREQPLRCLAARDSMIDLAGAKAVAGALRSIGGACQPGEHRIVACRPTPLADLYTHLGRAWDLNLTVVAADAELNAIGRRLRERLAGVDLPMPAPIGSEGIATHRVPNPDGNLQQSLLREFREHCANERQAIKARLAALPQVIEERTAAGVAGLSFRAVGRGERPVVAVNAIGQGIAAWLPLMERLSRRRRFIVWEMRQRAADGHIITFAEHCNDLHAVLREEGASSAHLVGWCTGAKLAVRYWRTHPGTVRSLVFLGGSFKYPGRAPELDSPYERNLEVMLRAIDRQPFLAERLRMVFAPANPAGGQLDVDDAALSGIPADLDGEVRRPFRDASTLVVYARQHVEFWSHDERATGSEVTSPILAIAGKRDQVVSPQGFQDALGRFPRARYVEIADGGHYCFYEHANVVADLIEDFVSQLDRSASA